MLFDTVEDMVINATAASDYESLRLNALSVLGLDYEISRDEFSSWDQARLSQDLYNKALEHYQRKNRQIAEKALPVIKEIHRTRGATIQNILVPFTDGKKQIGVAANLARCVETNNAELIKAMEKMITLAIIDHHWKEHLRDMDDLKQSVQNAVYEQKDPLLIYKFEGFEAFKRFLARVNEDTISFLMKAEIPEQQPDQVQEARTQRRVRLSEQKEESKSLLSGDGNASPQQTSRPPQEKVMPARSEKVAGRNDRVTVQYADGRVLKDVKFKKIEDDLRNNKCVIIN